jgi:hypothetical protein
MNVLKCYGCMSTGFGNVTLCRTSHFRFLSFSSIGVERNARQPLQAYPWTSTQQVPHLRFADQPYPWSDCQGRVVVAGNWVLASDYGASRSGTASHWPRLRLKLTSQRTQADAAFHLYKRFLTNHRTIHPDLTKNLSTLVA